MNTSIALAAIIGALGLGLVAVERPALAQTTAQALQPVPTIAASGYATASRSPDQSEVSLGVQATGRTSAEAQDSLNKAMDKVIKAVKETALPGLIVQTQGLSLNPEYEAESQGRRSGPPKIVGYHASNTIRVTVADVDKVGRVVDAGVGAGANQVLGIAFTLKNDAEARREAIRKATLDARAKAEAIAEALGVKLGKVMQATTGGAQIRPLRYQGGMELMARSAASIAPTPVEAGEVEVSAEVQVEFAIVEGK